MKKGDGGVVRKDTMHVTSSLENEEGGTELEGKSVSGKGTAIRTSARNARKDRSSGYP